MTRHRDAPCVLVIAGTDSSGGAGLAADIRAGHDLGARLRLAVTAVTAQTDRTVGGTYPVPADLLRRQIAMALEDGRVAAVKIGMLGSAPTAAAVAEELAVFAETRPVVLDPVLASTSGGALLDEAGIGHLIERLLPLAALVTPNRPELGLLAGRLGAAPAGAIELGAAGLLRAGAGAVLVKGGHGEGPVAEDVLFQRHRGASATFASPRFAVRMRGTGCRLATAIAIHLAAGRDMEAACASAKTYLSEVLLREGEPLFAPH